MTLWERWTERPQGVWLRKALFQVHLWSGIGIGLYVVAISISGSAIVFRNDLYKKLSPPPPEFAASGPRLTRQQLKEAAVRVYPNYAVAYVFEGRKPNQPVEIWMTRGEKKKQRLFNPYTGQDIGPAVPAGIRVLAWLADLHINLLGGKKGRAVNGVGAGLLTLLCLTGAVVWWPGKNSWRRSLGVRRSDNWKRFNWDLHSAVGIWSLLFILMWGVTGVLLVFPAPYQNFVARLTPINQPYRRGGPMALGDQILRWPSNLHFGNRWGWSLETLWVILGLVPVLLFVTGVIMWWNRVVRPARLRAAKEKSAGRRLTPMNAD